LGGKTSKNRIFTENNNYTLINILDQYALCREKDNIILGIVRSDYVPLQNKKAFEWFQPFLHAGEATLETAGSLKGGSKVWILAKIRNGEQAVYTKDEIAHYILLSNSHNGSMPVRVGFTPFVFALPEKGGKELIPKISYLFESRRGHFFVAGCCRLKFIGSWCEWEF
jgi:Domain of unknown function (DUF932)